MAVLIIPESEFKRQYKVLSKKYKSLKQDVFSLNNELTHNPYLGVDLGDGKHKIRMSIASKNKGKSGGARVITYVVEETEEDTVVHLLTIYDKSDISNISDTYIDELVKDINIDD